MSIKEGRVVRRRLRRVAGISENRKTRLRVKNILFSTSPVEEKHKILKTKDIKE